MFIKHLCAQYFLGTQGYNRSVLLPSRVIYVEFKAAQKY